MSFERILHTEGQDQNGNTFFNLGNIRVTYIRAETRPQNANWSGSDVIRFNAYRNDTPSDNSLHRGAEMPINDLTDLSDLAMILLEFSSRNR
jgi:hypothetical protein